MIQNPTKSYVLERAVSRNSLLPVPGLLLEGAGIHTDFGRFIAPKSFQFSLFPHWKSPLTCKCPPRKTRRK